MIKSALERSTRAKFSGERYDPTKISLRASANPRNYFEELLREKVQMVKNALPPAPGRILDLCCGDGNHLFEFFPCAERTFGVDFSIPALLSARDKHSQSRPEPHFVGGNARNLPFVDNCFDAVFCFSALYYMPILKSVLREIRRVLAPNGFCVLDLGNQWSLNTLVCQAYPELATPCHVSVPRMLRAIHEVDLQVHLHKGFQILPVWGARPWWLKPLLHPFLTKIMEIKVGGIMLDQWLSSIPAIKFFAFRHLILCRKPGVKT